MVEFANTRSYAETLDDTDPLQSFRKRFIFPTQKDGTPYRYFCGNSLGLQPQKAKDALWVELEDWAKYGVEGHFDGRNPGTAITNDLLNC